MSKFDILKGDKESDSYNNREELQGVVSKNSYDFINIINKVTQKHLSKLWADNIKQNRRYWRKHEPLRSALGLGINKVIIGIGASPSFNKNKDVLASYVLPDGVKDWPDRNFITIAANHQFKPLLEFGIIPDFVLLVDGSDVVYDQLCKDIPDTGRHTILITGVHASPKVVRDWTKQGRHILFYMTVEPSCMEAFKKNMGRNPDNYKIELGGNVMNGAWMIGSAVFQSTVFMGVGNDLSFPISDDMEQQRKGYYADGDYSSNAKGTGTGRDEAATHRRWAGFKLTKRQILTPGEVLKGIDRYNVELDLVGTSKTLWVYKTWFETTIMGQTKAPARLHYFNCTEGGILGVMAKDDSDEALVDVNNWYMLDTVCINQHTGAGMYHTAILKDAIEHFLKAKEMMRCQERNGLTKLDALYATVGGRTNMAGIAETTNIRAM